ncbi:MAG: aldehyde dehydrogenase family protein [Candidatus Binatia bacterium]|nr:aldehyde dehydrogenase family protein [Candidatus Binatia bacterium]
MNYDRIYVNGRWQSASNGVFPVLNPATEEVVAHAPNANVADIDAAILAAREAFDSGPWRRTTPRERAKVLRALVDRLTKRKEEIRSLLVTTGGAAWITHPIQVDTPLALLAQYADWAEKFSFEEMLPPVASVGPAGNQLNHAMAVYQPVGVCGLIPTWNFPLYVTVQKIGPAIAAGCTMVVKPSPYAPLIDLVVAEEFEQCDIPPGVFNVVTGESPALGARLVESPLVDKVSYTGSAATGKRIMAAAATTLKRVHLELGGKSAAIFLPDADFDAYAMYALTPAFFHAGQGCAMCTRVLVPRNRQESLLERLQNFLQAMVHMGNPADPNVTMGPVIRAERRAQIEEYIDSAHREGAKLVTGGKRPAHINRGYFVEPTIFADVRNDMRIAREEIFGPVLSVIPYDEVDDAIRIANDSEYGLGGAIYSADVPAAVELAKKIRTGSLNINGAVNLLHTPFGGFKQSGIGREGSRWGLLEYCEVQAIAWR